MEGSRTLAISADGTDLRTLKANTSAQNSSDILWVASDGRPYIILSYQTSIYSLNAGFWARVDMIDVSNGKTVKRMVEPRVNIQNYYADANGVVRMGISRKDKALTTKLHYRTANNKNFKVVDKAKRKNNESITAPSIFMEDPSQAMIFSNSNGYTSIKKFNLNDFTIGEKFFGVDGYDVQSIRTNAAGNDIAGITWIDTKYRTKWFDPAMENLQTNLEKAVPGQSVAIVSENQKRDRFIIRIGNASRPGAYYILDYAWGKMLKLANVNEKLNLKAYAPVKTVRYKARDGLEIEAVLTLPKGADAKDLPLIMMPHGGPYARDYERWDWQAQFLADRGYAVMQPNFRGSSGYGAEFTNKGELQWGLAMQDDLDDGVKHLVEQGIVNKERVCMMGGSYGGYAAMRAAQRNPEIYKCAISFAGVSDLPTMIRYDKGFLNGKFATAWFEDQIDDLKAVSPINFTEDFEVPILLVHGKKDRRVQVKQSRKLAKALKKAGKTVRYIEQKEGDHHFHYKQTALNF